MEMERIGIVIAEWNRNVSVDGTEIKQLYAW